jgi:hypothetical protein
MDSSDASNVYITDWTKLQILRLGGKHGGKSENSADASATLPAN